MSQFNHCNVHGTRALGDDRGPELGHGFHVRLDKIGPE